MGMMRLESERVLILWASDQRIICVLRLVLSV
jgi:hypothetical protein